MFWTLRIIDRGDEQTFRVLDPARFADGVLQALEQILARQRPGTQAAWGECELLMSPNEGGRKLPVQLFNVRDLLLKQFDLDAWAAHAWEAGLLILRLEGALTARPPAGGRGDDTGNLPDVGCDGKGCLDMTCPYCCSEFVDEEDYEKANPPTAKDLDHLEVKQSGFKLLPPAPGLCQECGWGHEECMPHNKDSLYYQTKFNMEHRRSPTWEDAWAHCTPEVRRAWKDAAVKVYRENGRAVPAELLAEETGRDNAGPGS